MPTKLLKPRCSYVTSVFDDDSVETTKKCRRIAYYKIDNHPYCYDHKRVLETEHMIRSGY